MPLWGQKGFAFLPAFLDLLKADYGAPIEQLDFVNATEAARRHINDWAAAKTMDRIRDLIPQGILDLGTTLVLTNAIYFKGDWVHPFDKAATSEAPFWISREQSVPLAMMNQTRELAYAESDLCQVLELPYAGEALSMVILQPREQDGLPRLENALAPETLARWMTGLAGRRVAVTLSSFRMTQEFRLKKVLQEMGMVHAFSDADFSKMTEQDKLFISAVIHKAFVDVNEEGTEAAAASAVIMARAAAPSGPLIKFRADRPFLFLIRHKPSGSILFIGRMVKPASPA